MSNAREENWRQLCGYAATMLELAQAGEWSYLHELSVERQARLERFFAEPVPPEMAAEVASALRHMQQVDSAIVTLSAAARNQVAHEMRLITQRKTASSAYTDPSHNVR